MALFAIMLAMGLASMASPAEAAPFAYVVNRTDSNVSVIDTNPPSVVATIPLETFSSPSGVAVAPGGKHAYVTLNNTATVSVIATASNTVVATIPVGSFPKGSPLPRMGNTSMSRIRPFQAPFL